MNKIKYVKSFSHGQITIPKEFREAIGLPDEFWMKLSLENGKLLIEPLEKAESSKDYLAKILSIKGDWFSFKDYQKTRREIEERIKKQP